jgi:Clostridial hydrophobic W
MARTPRQQEDRAPGPAAAIMIRPEARPVAPPDARPVAAPDDNQGRVAELRVSGHLMTLDSGLFCVFQAPGSPSPDGVTGLPGVRVTLPPGASGRPEAISISTFRQDGWLNGTAALVKVADGPAQVLVTIYQSPRQGPETAPRLQVLRLSGGAAGPAAAQPGAPALAAAPQAEPEVVAHVQRTGDVGGRIGEWIGTRGSRSWIEGFAVQPREGVALEDIEYQGVLGRGWLSPWVDGGKFCGSRGMALPLLGIRVRLKGAAARQWECKYEATFTDGSAAGPVSAEEACEAESLASMEAFRIELRRRDGAAAVPEREQAAGAKPARPARPAARIVKPGGSR